jgi:TonB-linked SusC/RagA family outer membrane protein
MKKIFLFCFMLFLSAVAFSQDKTIVKGTVRNAEQQPLAGVSVGVIGQNVGTTTDNEGRFTIQIPKPAGARLRFSFVGYTTLEVAANDPKGFNIVLKDDDQNKLEEVAVVAFGTQKKSSLTGSVVTISAKDLKGPTSNLTTTLAGRVPGVIAYQRTGEPGQDNANFFVRGVGTFGTGKQDPLIYIDGIESTPTDLARINPDNIDNFSVLKDAAATALYGSRGSNGVMLLTTKLGAQGITRINARVENRLSTNTQNIKMADNITYMRLANEAVTTRDFQNQGGVNPPYDPNKIDNTAAGKDPLLYPSNDWVDILTKKNTRNLAVNLDVSGGNEKAIYYVGLTYDENNGLLKESGSNNFKTNVRSRTYSLLSNITINFTKTTKALISVRGTFDDVTSPVGGGSRIFTLASQSNPVAFPAIYPQSFLPYAQHPLFGSALRPNSTTTLYTNPFAESVSGYQNFNRAQLIPQITINQNLEEITKGLTARVMAFTQRDADFTLVRQYSPFYYQARQVGGQTLLTSLNEPTPGQTTNQIGIPPTEYLTYFPSEKNVSTVVYGEAVINYLRTFNDNHSIGGRFITTMRNSLTGNASSLQLSLPKRNLNFLGQANYAYKDKYLVDFSFGYNGSERFSKEKRYGFFPSISAAWILTKEKFMEPLNKVITNLKLRGSYGLSGNDQIGRDVDRFFYLSEVQLNNIFNSATFGENYGYTRPGISTTRYANPDITFEKTKQLNLGLELSLFNDFNFVIEAYKKNTSSILLPRTNVPTTAGLQALTYANVGEASSKGIDFSFNYYKNFSKDYWAKIYTTFTYAASKVLYNEEPNYPDNLKHLSRVGRSAGQLYGLVAERLFTDETEVRNSPRQNFGVYGAGDIKYRDINGDGIISLLDIVPIGLPKDPEIIYGFGGSFGIKQFDFSFFFQGSTRSSFFINPGSSRNDNTGNVEGIAPFVTFNGTESGLLDIIAQDHWSEDNRNAYAFWPRLSNQVVANNAVASSWWLRRGDFLRLKQVEMGYNFSEKLAKKVGLNNLRLYCSALNVFSISSFKLWEVEMAGNGLGYPLQRVYNLGIKVGI